jgi:hypothetical protein
MKKEFSLLVSIGILISVQFFACHGSSSDPSAQPAGADIIQKYNFHVDGQPTSTSLTLPPHFTDANWGLKQEVCQQTGYDLTLYAGQDITAIKYTLLEKYSNDTLSLFVLAKDQTVICGYVAASSLTPGIIALNDPNINISTSVHQYDTLLYTLTSRDVVDQGEIVPITLTIKNTGSGLFEVLLGSPEISLQVLKDNDEVWDPAFGLAFPGVVHQLSIPAGETKTYEFSWDQKDNTGNQVLPGVYSIKASFIGNAEQVDISIGQ